MNRDHVPESGSYQDRSLAARLGRIRAIPARWWLAGVVVLIVLAVALNWMRHGSSEPKVAPLMQQSIPLVTVITPRVTPVTSNVTFSGTIFARYDVPIGAEGEAGRIVAIYVEAGDRVKRGQLLAKLDQSVLAPQLKRLAASLEEARAQAALSQAEYGRAKGVEAAGALSAEEIERRRAASVTDEARVNVAAAQYAEMQARLDRTEIRAPADGVILTRTAELGQTASPGGDPLFRLARGGEIEMRGSLAEQDFARVALDQPAQVYLTGYTAPFKGKVRLLGAVIDPKTRLGEVRIALEENSALRPGAFARGQVTVGNATRPVLPQTAVLSDLKGSYVYVINDDKKVERRAVQVADTTLAGVVIGDGLKGNEQVVAMAGGFLREGEQVELAATPEQQASK
ncbi:MAG TPA: efflux RND transporter periplasmic adaptor subunit [Steroidobacteraceae bacterium]|nr:efflux RND transporter periplasmic adaptor subunit [Steroidobacteraceae bacterium]